MSLYPPKYAIWDIDNCLADDKWRAHLIDFTKTGNARYEAYNAQMLGDPAHHLQEFRFMARLATPVFFTGRCEKWQAYTSKWLRDGTYTDGSDWTHLYMRDNDDQSTPAELKRKMLERLIKRVGVNNIVAAFDDIPAVIDMYRSYGIAGCVLQINSDFSGIYEPRDLAPISNHA